MFKGRGSLVPVAYIYGTQPRRPGREAGIFVSAKPHNGTGDGEQRLIQAAHGPNFIRTKMRNLRIAIQWPS